MFLSLKNKISLLFVLLLFSIQEVLSEEQTDEDFAYKYNPKLATATTTFDSTLPQPNVTLAQGTYIGRTFTSRGGRHYDTFVGMRYAKRVQRFQQMADLPDPSNKVRNATSYGPFCLQADWLKNNKVLGDEDCLFINVYTPKLQEKDGKAQLFPVLMYVHGGAFLFGSGNVYLPDYLMDEDLVLVTMNYRLGVLGFLSTQDTEVSGNMGLKDQIVALRWIQKNIQAFSGDPKNVIIFGESAGGASVSFHMLSKLAKGLFVGGISHSGTSLCPWAFVRDTKSVARKLGEILNCPTNSSKELVTCLKQMDARFLVTSQEKLTVWNRDPFAMFAPSAEFDDGGGGRDIYLSESPFQVLCHGRQNRIPWILGVCSDEGLTFHAAAILSNGKLTQELNQNWSTIAPVTLLYQDTARSKSYVSSKLRKFYFGNDEILPLPKGKDLENMENGTQKNPHQQNIWSKSLRNLTNLYSDRFFFHCTRTAAALHAIKAPTYLYRFSYPGKYSIIQSMGLPKFGVAHGDDLQYFFPFSRFPYLPLDSEMGQFSQKVIKVWTTFAETRQPTYEDEDGVAQEWKPIRREDMCEADEETCERDLEWLNLDGNFSLMRNLYEDRMQFWDYLPLHENDGERGVYH